MSVMCVVCVCVFGFCAGETPRETFFTVFFHFRAASRLTELALSVCETVSLSLASPDERRPESRVPRAESMPESRLCAELSSTAESAERPPPHGGPAPWRPTQATRLSIDDTAQYFMRSAN